MLYSLVHRSRLGNNNLLRDFATKNLICRCLSSIPKVTGKAVPTVRRTADNRASGLFNKRKDQKNARNTPSSSSNVAPEAADSSLLHDAEPAREG
jgi:hypothetical protein